MAYKQSAYTAHSVDSGGDVAYSAEENAVWAELINRQMPIVETRACDEYLQGLQQLALPRDRVPQCREVTAVLSAATGWALEPVPALIPFDRFFSLLANRRFPAATFIRKREELDYLKEPDIFHEVFGHCPLLTLPHYAAFVEYYGKLGLAANPHERILLARLFWFTVEFGLIRTKKGLRAYGGGILSSISETVYAVESPVPERKAFDIMTTLKTEYRIDEIQKCYFVLDQFEQLYDLVNIDLISMVHQAETTHDKGPDSAC